MSAWMGSLKSRVYYHLMDVCSIFAATRHHVDESLFLSKSWRRSMVPNPKIGRFTGCAVASVVLRKERRTDLPHAPPSAHPGADFRVSPWIIGKRHEIRAKPKSICSRHDLFSQHETHTQDEDAPDLTRFCR